MCGRFNQSKLDQDPELNKWTQKLTRINRNQQANISAGMLAIAIGMEGPMEAEFGFRPVWDTKKLFINARAEGKGNEANNPTGWEVAIDSMASFKKSFLQSRCVIPVDSFIEGPEKEKLSKPFLIQTATPRTIYLGAVCNQYTKDDGSQEYSFAIITTPANAICKQIGHHRSPMILSKNMIGDWLSENQSPSVLKQIVASGYDEPDFVAYPLNPELVKSGKLHGEEVLQPLG